jgi:hypothetical protein
MKFLTKRIVFREALLISILLLETGAMPRDSSMESSGSILAGPASPPPPWPPPSLCKYKIKFEQCIKLALQANPFKS